MAVQSLRKEESRNPRTLEEALALVKHVESLFMPWNIDALADGFTEDCVEVWVLRDGRIALWEAAFNVGRADQAASVADALR